MGEIQMKKLTITTIKKGKYISNSQYIYIIPPNPSQMLQFQKTEKVSEKYFSEKLQNTHLLIILPEHHYDNGSTLYTDGLMSSL